MSIPARFDSEWLRPIGGSPDPKPCIFCLTREARWVAGTPDRNDLWCSYCFLYETSWGKNNSDGIAWLAETYQGKHGQSVIKDGRVRPEFADRILSSIISSSRVILTMRSRSR